MNVHWKWVDVVNLINGESLASNISHVTAAAWILFDYLSVLCWFYLLQFSGVKPDLFIDSLYVVIHKKISLGSGSSLQQLQWWQHAVASSPSFAS